MLVKRGACSFVEKAMNVQEADSLAMLLFDSEPGCITMGGNDTEQMARIHIPSISISHEAGERLLTLLSESPGSAPEVSVEPIEVSGLDPSALLLWALAVGTVLAGSLWSGHDYLVSLKATSEDPEKVRKEEIERKA